MSTIQISAGDVIAIGNDKFVASTDANGKLVLSAHVDAPTRKALNFDKATGNLSDDDGNVVGRMNFRSKMTSDAIPELGNSNVTVVVSDAYANGYDLAVSRVANTNKKQNPDWANGADIGTRQEWALYLTKVD